MRLPLIQVELTAGPGVSFQGLGMGDTPDKLRVSLRDYLYLPDQVTGTCIAKFWRKCDDHWHEMNEAETLHVVMMGLAMMT